jgi:NAD+ kinase
MIKVVHKGDDKSSRLAQKISSRLPKSSDDSLLVVCVGGDGTILRAIHEHIDELDKAVFFGVKSGHLGFFADYTEDSLDALIQALTTHEFSITRYDLLESSVWSGGKESHYLCLNEFQILSGSRTIHLDVILDGLLFESFRGNGMVFSTPAGSTGLNKSLDGAIIDPSIEAVQITEVAPINSNSYRTIGSPMVLNIHRSIVVKTPEPTAIEFSFDHEVMSFENFEELRIIASKRKVQIAQIEEINFFQRIKKAFL